MRLTKVIGLILVLLGALSFAQVGQASHLSCGDVLTSNTKLDSDLTCPSGSGLIIGASGITVKFNGHTITGDPSVGGSHGINNTGFNNVTIKGGSIVGFEQGIRGIGVSGFTIKNMIFSGQTSSHAIDILDSDSVVVKNSSFTLPTSFIGPEAIRLESVAKVTVKNVDIEGGFVGVNFACGLCNDTELPTNGVVKNNVIRETFTGVLIANSTDATIKNNTIFDSVSVVCPAPFCGSSPLTIPARGIHISFQDNTGTLIKSNKVFDNDGIGIRASGEGRTDDLVLKKNFVHDNTGSGIELKNVDESKIMKNLIEDNGSDGLAILSTSTDNLIKKNTASGNIGFDMLHDGTSTPNTWKKNTCTTSSGAEVDCP